MLVGISVEDAKKAFEVAIQNGGRPVHEPTVLQSPDGQEESVISEVEMYGDVVMRFISGTFKVDVLPHCMSQCTFFTSPQCTMQLTLHACHCN